MSNDWQPGDLALCVRRGILDHVCPAGVIVPLVGGVYTVSRVWMHPEGCRCLDFDGVENGNPDPHSRIPFWGFDADRFVKVTPPEADEFDREVIDLLNKQEVSA